MVFSALENVVPMAHPQERSITELWSEGWPQTPHEFEALVDVFGDRLIGYAYRRLGNRHDAEDVVQKVFVRAFQVRKRYRKVRKVGPYLYRMTANACIDWQRYSSRRPETPLGDIVAETVPADRPDAGDEAANSEESRRVERLVNELPKRQAEVVRLRAYCDLPFAEIADALGTSEATVKSRFRYAIEKLKVKILGRKEAE